MENAQPYQHLMSSNNYSCAEKNMENTQPQKWHCQRWCILQIPAATCPPGNEAFSFSATKYWIQWNSCETCHLVWFSVSCIAINILFAQREMFFLPLLYNQCILWSNSLSLHKSSDCSMLYRQNVFYLCTNLRAWEGSSCSWKKRTMHEIQRAALFCFFLCSLSFPWRGSCGFVATFPVNFQTSEPESARIVTVWPAFMLGRNYKKQVFGDPGRFQVNGAEGHRGGGLPSLSLWSKSRMFWPTMLEGDLRVFLKFCTCI